MSSNKYLVRLASLVSGAYSDFKRVASRIVDYASHPEVIGWNARGEPTLAALSFFYNAGSDAFNGIRKRFSRSLDDIDCDDGGVL